MSCRCGRQQLYYRSPLKAADFGEGIDIVIAIVDDGGNLLYLQRLDGTQTGSIEVALQKAKTAVHFKRPSKALEDAVTGGRTVVLALGAMPIEGGLPLMVDDKLIGAI